MSEAPRRRQLVRSPRALRCAGWAGFAFVVLITGCAQSREVVAEEADAEPMVVAEAQAHTYAQAEAHAGCDKESCPADCHGHKAEAHAGCAKESCPAHGQGMKAEEPKAEPQPRQTQARRRRGASAQAAEVERLRQDNAALAERVNALEEALAASQGNVNTLQAKLEAILSVPQIKDTSKPRVYRVREGDTLSSISEQPNIYNDARLWRRIFEANRAALPNPQALKPGQQLIIPR